jgi:tripartite-type tricarboxylate transporter receptor subunit TctC
MRLGDAAAQRRAAHGAPQATAAYIEKTEETTMGMSQSLKYVLAATAALANLAPAGPARADYPDRPVTVVVGFPAGGSADPFARLFSQELSRKWGQPVVVENKAGANALIGTSYVAKAAPDGYTLLVALGNHTMNPAMYKNLQFDTAKDFAPIALLALAPNVLVVRNNFPAQDFKEFLQVLKASPGKYTYASSGNGGTPHLAGVLFSQKTGTSILHVPYKGAAPAIADLMAGTVDMSFATLSSALPQIKAGKIRALAITHDKRVPQLPDVPSLDELGIKGADIATWYGFLAPTGTPRPVVEKIHADLAEIAARPAIREQVTTMLGSVVIQEGPAQFQRRIDTELTEWEKVIKASGLAMN